mmetsp:Transcript_27848/g.85437  ORF Transcript_27848/g.85437 Transcript_27848/m.85437 type:complete len:220 (+) Transcript_27848:131-790(+)
MVPRVLSEYEQLRERKIAANKAHMQSLGLGDAKKALRQAPQRQRKNAFVQRPRTGGKQRRSPRLASQPPEALLELEVFEPASNKRRRSDPRPVKDAAPPSTEAQRRALRGRALDLTDFRTFLEETERLSVKNTRAVMRQVTQLAEGGGVTYTGWRAGVAFRRGQALELAEDLHAVRAAAQDHEDEHGVDKGNGWLLRHPLTKLILYQGYLLAETTGTPV